MSRRKAIKKREVEPDPMYNSELVTKFINRMMVDGKKGKSEKIFYEAIKVLAEKTNLDPIEAFQKAVQSVRPQVEVKSRRVGGATYQVPVEVPPLRQNTLALRWLVTYSRLRGERGMAAKLAAEFNDAINGTGGAVKKKEDVFRMAESNKAFAHYRW